MIVELELVQTGDFLTLEDDKGNKVSGRVTRNHRATNRTVWLDLWCFHSTIYVAGKTSNGAWEFSDPGIRVTEHRGPSHAVP